MGYSDRLIRTLDPYGVRIVALLMVYRLAPVWP